MKTKKIEENLNSRLHDTLGEYKEIESSAIGLFAIDSIYDRPPCFAFRFKDGTSEDYEKVRKIILEFKGHLQWIFSEQEGSKNRLIEPLELKELRDSGAKNSKNEILQKIGERYFDICDNAVNDIKSLCEWIEIRLL